MPQVNSANIEKNAPRVTEINVHGLAVQELVFPCWDRRGSKLVWCRESLNATTVGGLPNPCFHCDFGYEYTIDSEEKAREAVKKLFLEYYHLE